MRALIVSDLHANLEALAALPGDFEQLWVLGDLVNYGPNPAEVLEFVRGHATLVVRGNHDHSAGFGEDPRCSERFRAMARETGAYTRSVLSQEQIQYLRGLPLTASVDVDGLRVVLCHAAPADPLFEYRRADSPLWLSDTAWGDFDVRLVGHTHLPFQLFLAERRIVNPGSVGQPKHGRPEACYAIWQDGEISLASVPYDFEPTVAKLGRLSLTAAVLDDLAFVLRNGSVPPAAAGEAPR